MRSPAATALAREASLLPELLALSAQRNPLAIALTHADQSLTYAELQSQVAQFAAGLLQLGLARNERVDKRRDEALAIARTVQMQRPKEDSGYVLEADIQATGKNWDKAAGALRTGLKQSSSQALAIKLHAVLRAGGKGTEAEQLASQWQKDHPQDAAFAFYLGDLAVERKDYGAAEQLYTKVLKQQPDNALALNNLAWVSGKLKRDAALGFAERANSLVPNQPAFMDTLAGLQLEKGDYVRAMALQGRALALQPQNAMLKLNLARIQLRAGKKDLAKQSLDDLSKLGDTFAAQAEVSALRKELAPP